MFVKKYLFKKCKNIIERIKHSTIYYMFHRCNSDKIAFSMHLIYTYIDIVIMTLS